MTKKILAVLMAVSLLLSCGVFALANETPTDIPTDTPTDVTALRVVFDANGGEGSLDYVLAENGAIVIPGFTMNKGVLEFKGWNTHVDGTGVPYKAGDTVKLADVAADNAEQTKTLEEGNYVTLYAQWAASGYEEYIITYKANGGEGDDIFDDFGYNAGMEAEVFDNEFVREGYEFVAWNTEADGTGTAYAPYDTIVVNSDIVLYAIWEGGEDVSVDDEIDDETDSENVETGDASAVAVALGVGIVALGAVAVLKKKD